MEETRKPGRPPKTEETQPTKMTGAQATEKMLNTSVPVDYIEFHQATGVSKGGMPPQKTWNKTKYPTVDLFYHPGTATVLATNSKTNETYIVPTAGIMVLGIEK